MGGGEDGECLRSTNATAATHKQGPRRNVLKDWLLTSRCQRLTRRSSAEMNVSPSAFTDSELTWYACALAKHRLLVAATTLPVVRNCGIRRPPLPAGAPTVAARASGGGCSSSRIRLSMALLKPRRMGDGAAAASSGCGAASRTRRSWIFHSLIVLSIGGGGHGGGCGRGVAGQQGAEQGGGGRASRINIYMYILHNGPLELRRKCAPLVRRHHLIWLIFSSISSDLR